MNTAYLGKLVTLEISGVVTRENKDFTLVCEIDG